LERDRLRWRFHPPSGRGMSETLEILAARQTVRLVFVNWLMAQAAPVPAT